MPKRGTLVVSALEAATSFALEEVGGSFRVRKDVNVTVVYEQAGIY